MWLNILSAGLKAGGHIYKKRQETKMAMADAQHRTAMDKVKLFFDYFSTLPSWFTNLWILVVASIFGIKGTQIFRNGKK